MEISIKNSQRSINLDQRKIGRELGRALQLLGLHTAELSVLLVNSRRMKHLNARYRGIDKVTDVLSFPMDGQLFHAPSVPLGDIVICIPKAVSQAREYGVSFHDELLRLMLHGLLHLIGYDHEKNSYQKIKMQRKERELLNAVKKVAKKR
ncbi:MAG: rRNA maturation RNase YbeY [Nitrospirae bacterium]|nr:rRNA maturation RNase YbeY [Nitrospirota bacterium]